MKSSTHSAQGIVLLMVLGILGLMSVLAITFVKITSLEKSISKNYLERTRSLLAAESGIEYAMSRVQKMQGGVMRAGEASEMEFLHGIVPGHRQALKASFQRPESVSPLSGIVGVDTVPATLTNLTYYILRVEDESGKINLNDTDAQWNWDDDPVDDDPSTDLDLVSAPHRLAAMVEDLARILFDSGSLVPIRGTEISVAIFNARSSLPGERFSSLRQVRELLSLTSLTDAEIDTFMWHVTLDSWQDEKVLKPTFQLHISTPGFAPIPLAETYDDLLSNKYFNIYIYSDFQTQYFERETRSPININSAPMPVLKAMLGAIRGWYLYEGTPSGLMDASNAGPWFRGLRSSGMCWRDYDRGKDVAGVMSNWTAGVPSPAHPSLDTQLFNQTRHGEARITKSMMGQVPGMDLDDNGIDDTFADALAARLWFHIHGDPVIGTPPQPFLTLDELTRQMYEWVDLQAEIVAGEFDTAFEEASRYPYRIGAGTSGTSYLGLGGGDPILGFDRYMADAVLAMLDPNAHLNDHNPDYHLFRHVDKAQLTQHTTEACLEPTGSFYIESMGVSVGPNGETLGEAMIKSRMDLFYRVNISTQDEFMEDYNQSNHNSLYSIMDEISPLSLFPAAGADLDHGTGDIAVNGAWGPSLTSYPEPIRNNLSFTIERHPDDDQAGVYFSKYDGNLQLSTLQLDRSSYLEDEFGQLPTFMAPMGWRYVASMSAGQWAARSRGVGGMLPAVWGNNNELNWDMTRLTGMPIAITSDEVNTANVSTGRGAVLQWIEYYGNVDMDLTSLWFTPPIVAGGGPDIPIVNTTFPNVPFWYKEIPPTPIAKPWFNDVTGTRYENFDTTMHHFGDHAFTIPFVGNYPIDGEPGGTTTDYVEPDVIRLAWNMPTDCPLTPHHIDPATGYPVQRTQGCVLADGVLSDPGRLLSYKATNLGSNGGIKGTIMFWVKPNFDVGFSNRMRTFFSVGHVGDTPTDYMSIVYFPASPHPSKTDFPGGGDEESQLNRLVWGPNGTWPLSRNSIMAGNMHFHFSQYPGPGNTEITIANYFSVTETATDFMPYRDIVERGTHTSYGLYGRQWNLMALNFDTDLDGSFTPGISPGADSKIDYYINGLMLERYTNNPRATVDKLDPLLVAPPTKLVESPGEFDPVWEESHMHSWEQLNGAGGDRGEPENLHIGEGYMRFGWLDEAGGPVSDSTYDDIVGWANRVPPSTLDEIWKTGRYFNEVLGNPIVNNSAIGLYTSPDIDVFGKISGVKQYGELSIRSVSWTLWWPRNNWKPVDNTSDPNWGNWLTTTYNGVQGYDLHNLALVPPENDPVTGVNDSITVDLWSADDSKWLFSEDTGTGINKFDNMETMPSTAAGSTFSRTNRLNLQQNDPFRFRVYFHLQPGQALLESPTFDDITFTFTASSPRILEWEISR